MPPRRTFEVRSLEVGVHFVEVERRRVCGGKFLSRFICSVIRFCATPKLVRIIVCIGYHLTCVTFFFEDTLGCFRWNDNGRLQYNVPTKNDPSSATILFCASSCKDDGYRVSVKLSIKKFSLGIKNFHYARSAQIVYAALT